MVEALQRKHEDTRREVEEERVATATAKNLCDAAQAEAAFLREVLEGSGHSLALLASHEAPPARHLTLMSSSLC
jgi:hypothetical protein